MNKIYKIKKKANNNQVMLWLFLAILVLAFYFLFFNSNIFQQISDSIRHIATPKETDPTIWQRDFHSNRESALETYSNITQQFQNVVDSPQDTCFGFFQAPDKNFFEKGYNIQYLENTKKDGGYLRMLQWRADQVKPKDKKDISNWAQLQLKYDIKGYLPCAVYGFAAEDFYEDILENGIIKPTPTFNFSEFFRKHKTTFTNFNYNFNSDSSKSVAYGIYGFPVDKFGLYPFQNIWLWDAINGTQISIDKKKDIEYYQGDNVNEYILFKYNHTLCVIPASTDGIFGAFKGGCDSPSNGLMDSDCLDSKSGKDRLPNLLKGSLNKYICKKSLKDFSNYIQK